MPATPIMPATTVCPHTTDLLEMWEKHDGRIVTINGVSCMLRVLSYRATFPNDRVVLYVTALPVDPLADKGAIDVLESDNSVLSEIFAQLE